VIPILTPAESSELDRESAARRITTLELMENAGRAVARSCAAIAGGTYGRRAVVVCGKGNNGGDGLAAARHIERSGLLARVVLIADPSELRGEPASNLRRFVSAAGVVHRYGEDRLSREVDRADVVVDAIFGTGFRGAPENDFARAIEVINDAPGSVVAVDIPSGVEGETGLVRGRAVHADATVTFGSLKPGLVFHPGAGYAGEVEVADIGFPPDLVRSDLWLVEAEDVAGLVPSRAPESHKRASGVVLVVAGSRSMTGAAALAAGAAYRAGAGLVTVAVPEGILSVVQAAVPEATFLPLPQTQEGTLAEGASGELLERLSDVQAMAIGPGLTTNPSTVELVRRLVAECPVPFVLDADGLNAFAGRGSLLAERRSEVVITPHAGEFGRLTGLSSSEVLEDRVGHARKAAAEFRCTVLLKGSRTVVAEPGGRVRINPTGSPYLATGGTGDVLTGAVAAFLARGLAPADAAVLAAYVHGVAGRMAGAELGEGTVAPDVLARFPAALAALSKEAR
jgi:ADP-dependent NAD(P)H-hydrate dehydratase / NAD(P)H-hydrate epimerase